MSLEAKKEIPISVAGGKCELEDLEEEIIEIIESIHKDGKVIGKGMTAEVFTSKTNPNICYKIITNREKFYNFVDLEKNFLERCQKIGVRSPKPILCVRKGEFEVLAMERIEGNSVEDVIAKNLGLPENFNIDEFFQELGDMVELLHRNQIYHRDLHEGNAMIGQDDGRPWIIDYGSAKLDFDEENAKKSYFVNPTSKRRETVIFRTTDENNIAEMKKKLRKYAISKQRA